MAATVDSEGLVQGQCKNNEHPAEQLAARRGTNLDSFWDVTHGGRIHPHQTSHFGDDGLCVFKSETQESPD